MVASTCAYSIYGCWIPFARKWFDSPKAYTFMSKGLLLYQHFLCRYMCEDCAKKLPISVIFYAFSPHQYEQVKASDCEVNFRCEFFFFFFLLHWEWFWSRCHVLHDLLNVHVILILYIACIVSDVDGGERTPPGTSFSVPGHTPVIFRSAKHTPSVFFLVTVFVQIEFVGVCVCVSYSNAHFFIYKPMFLWEIGVLGVHLNMSGCVWNEWVHICTCCTKESDRRKNVTFHIFCSYTMNFYMICTCILIDLLLLLWIFMKVHHFFSLTCTFTVDLF